MTIDPSLFRPAEDRDDLPAHRSEAPTIGELILNRMNRRRALAGMAALGGGALASLFLDSAALAETAVAEAPFEEPPAGLDPRTHLPPGYREQVLVAWGDPLLPGAPPFELHRQTAAAQEGQFGYNNDFLAFMPLPRGSNSSEHGLLFVNHEYTDARLMFPPAAEGNGEVEPRERAEIEMAAHGLSVVEIRRRPEGWEVVADSPLARRFSMLSTPMEVSGPAAGDPRLQTAADPAGRRVIGTLNNCAGGVTPWGTVLTCEENFNMYFRGEAPEEHAKSFARYSVGGRNCRHPNWGEHHERFDLQREPHEPYRFGWVVEIDPYNPQHTPVKRTALGRFKHEGAAVVVAADGRVVVYMGDDQQFDYVYKFVSAGKYHPENGEANRNLLDRGTLFVARFEADGSLRWLPLVQGQAPLTAENGFATQADVLLNARLAADLLEATPLDRPEDIEVHPTTGKVYVILTNNNARTQADHANPRPANKHGHILELIPEGGDHTSPAAAWNVFLLAGNPAAQEGARYGGEVSDSGWLSCPDNGVFDSRGRLWIATDGAPKAAKRSDGLYLCETEGTDRARTRLFFRAPIGAEVCGPCFTPDDRTLFLAVQHPGEGSTFADPSTRWPDFDEKLPPRPAVVAITREDGRPIAG